MKTLTMKAKLEGTITLKSEYIFSINGLGYKMIDVVPFDKFEVRDNVSSIMILQDSVAIYKLEARKALLVHSELINNKFITTLQTF